MTMPNLVGLLSQYEQLDNQKEQLLLQRQEQTARNIAQAVSTLVATPMEGRAGYLGMLKAELGLDTGFLNALAQTAPTPTAMLLNMGLQKAIDSGATSSSDVAAYALGSNPIAFRQNAEIGKFMEDGTVPSFIKALPQEAQGTAIQELLAKAGGLPDFYELMHRDQIGAVRNKLAPDGNTRANEQGANQRQANSLSVQQSEGAAGRGVQREQLAQNASQFNRELQFKTDEFLGRNATQLLLGGMSNDTRLRTSKVLRGTGPGGKLTVAEQRAASLYGNMDINDLLKLYDGRLKADNETQNATGAGFLAETFGAGQVAENMSTLRGQSRMFTNDIETELRRRQSDNNEQQPATQSVPQQQSYNAPQIQTFAPVTPATFGQYLNQTTRP